MIYLHPRCIKVCETIVKTKHTILVQILTFDLNNKRSSYVNYPLCIMCCGYNKLIKSGQRIVRILFAPYSTNSLLSMVSISNTIKSLNVAAICFLLCIDTILFTKKSIRPLNTQCHIVHGKRFAGFICDLETTIYILMTETRCFCSRHNRV